MGARFPGKSQRKEKLQRELEEILKKISSKNVKQVILFGSLASGDVRSTSDLDLIIIQATDKRFLDRLEEWYAFLEPNVAIDILVYTPEEIADMKSWNSFIKTALAQGEVLYEAA